ncbi:heavy metal sensor histidine kinase [Methylomonas sp. 11b]|uniref:heavy metal sensor histidine kinase n=1 Tax=Methylomonas sp. 11b TaxID=1168169 RepID=UPI00047E8ECD|nr:heavy metal sensor histidine kinase [Methylomonas sp. 11b]PKM13671.1 MAG: two-component sensor histidine kinase [Gammaproteobacteria bacterium HGW-Gammaproteobacteria-3]
MRLIGRKSITFRLTLLFASVSTTVLLLLGLLIGSLVERHFEELDMELLDGKLELLQHTLKKVRSDSELEALPGQLQDSMVGHPGLAVVVLKPNGETLYSTEGAKLPEELLAGAGDKHLHPMFWTDPENHRYRGISAEVPTRIEGAAPVVVAVSTDLLHHEHFMQSFRTALWTVMGLAALLTGFLGWVAARQGLAPLRDISRSAAGITANHLDQRLPLASIPVELAEVAKTLNEMLARLEGSFRRLSDFSSDIAHELRTPVSNMLTQTQVTLSKTRTLDEYRDVLASNAEEFERLSRMIADMLFLAKSDNNLIVPHREKFDLVVEVSSLVEFYEALAEEKGVSLTYSGKGAIFGDRLMLRRAVNNLLSNALRHTPKGERIKIRVDDSDVSIVVLSVQNTGETITPAHLPRLFDRFYRVHASRQRFGEGAGLGLAITRSIAHAHGGEALAHSEGGITTFEIRLPV